jgi:hypothetical protein
MCCACELPDWREREWFDPLYENVASGIFCRSSLRRLLIVNHWQLLGSEDGISFHPSHSWLWFAIWVRCSESVWETHTPELRHLQFWRLKIFVKKYWRNSPLAFCQRENTDLVAQSRTPECSRSTHHEWSRARLGELFFWVFSRKNRMAWELLS